MPAGQDDSPCCSDRTAVAPEATLEHGQRDAVAQVPMLDTFEPRARPLHHKRTPRRVEVAAAGVAADILGTARAEGPCHSHAGSLCHVVRDCGFCGLHRGVFHTPCCQVIAPYRHARRIPTCRL